MQEGSARPCRQDQAGRMKRMRCRAVTPATGMPTRHNVVVMCVWLQHMSRLQAESVCDKLHSIVFLCSAAADRTLNSTYVVMKFICVLRVDCNYCG